MRDGWLDTYLSEADVRHELARMFDVCNECRRCVAMCGAFPTLFELLDSRPGATAGEMTPVQQDGVVDQCFQCTLCRIGCPFSPERSEAAVDLPAVMRRALAMRRSAGQIGIRARASAMILISTVLTGHTRPAALIGATFGAAPRSFVRRVVKTVSGLSAARLVASRARQPFSDWFRRRPVVRHAAAQGRVAVYPTCTVEHHDPAIGRDLVHVLERNGVECTLSGELGCCGAPWLDIGDLRGFSRHAGPVASALAAAVRCGHEIVVPQPRCSHALRSEYPLHVPGEDAQLVAAHTFDAAEYLLRLHRGDTTTLDTDFADGIRRRPGAPDVERHEAPSVTLHAPCHLRSQKLEMASRDLIRLTGARVEVVEGCSGRCAVWGLRAEHEKAATSMAAALGDRLVAAGGDVVAGGCHHANTAIAEHTGVQPLHPVQVVARAYGMPLD